MYITKLLPWDKNKIKVYLDDSYAFFLYSAEIKRFKLCLNEEISQITLNEIYENVLLPRCRNKLISLLEYKDRTTQEAKERLLREGYPEEIVNRVLLWAEEYHFLDMNRFATGYVKNNAGKKGSRLLRLELNRRGVEKELAEELLTEVKEKEEEQIEAIFFKRFRNLDLSEEKQRMRVIRYFLRNGFSYEDVQKVLNKMVKFE